MVALEKDNEDRRKNNTVDQVLPSPHECLRELGGLGRRYRQDWGRRWMAVSVGSTRCGAESVSRVAGNRRRLTRSTAQLFRLRADANKGQPVIW